jgi:UDP-N-acetylmuramoylalanine--D-glutamate ligase
LTPVTGFAGENVALFGLGGSGLATAQALQSGGAILTAWDDSEPARARAAAAGIRLGDLDAAPWRDFAALVLSPGVPLTHPRPHWVVERAQRAGVAIIGDIELFCRERRARAPGAPFLAVTGTNGKSTTSALIAHLLRVGQCAVELGGNIGTAILALEPPDGRRIHVIECSSYQIDLSPSLDPTIGIMLNVTPDHLDRHGTLENYAAVKAKLVNGADLALIGVDDAFGQAMSAWQDGRNRRHPERRNLPVSVERRLDFGVFVEAQRIVMIDERGERTLGNLFGVGRLRGKHNAQNAAFAAAAAERMGLSAAVIQAGLESFPGLQHRMEQVGESGRVLFVNDSKATNADAAEKALLSFDSIYWIVGGKPKEGGLATLKPLFGKVKKAYLIGEASEPFAGELEGRVAFERCGRMEVALARAAEDASASPAEEPVVLLSPACASFDQYPNFEVRGDHFRELAAAWILAHPRGQK